MEARMHGITLDEIIIIMVLVVAILPLAHFLLGKAAIGNIRRFEE